MGLIKIAALLYIGYYLGSRKIITDADLEQLVEANKDVLTQLKQKGLV